MPLFSFLRPLGLPLSAALSCTALSLLSFAAPYQVKAGGIKNQLRATENLSAKPDSLKLPEENPVNPADRFPGGKKALQNYLGQNLNYPALALKEKRSGQVLIQVSVDAKGHLKEFKTLQADHELFAGEALRVLKAMPEWQPEDNRVTSSDFVFPIVFYLQDQGATPPALAKPAPGNYHLMEPFFVGAIGNPYAARPVSQQAGMAPASGDKIYTMVEAKPEFPGGDTKMKEFIRSNLRYPADALRNGKQGLVVVQFTVDREGQIRDIQVVKSLGYGTDEESMRVVGLMPAFKPATQNGKPVSFRYTLPVRFGIPDRKVVEEEYIRSRRGRSRSFE